MWASVRKDESRQYFVQDFSQTLFMSEIIDSGLARVAASVLQWLSRGKLPKQISASPQLSTVLLDVRAVHGSCFRSCLTVDR